MPTPDELDRPPALPRWVAAVDVLTVTIALASVAAAVGGGFKIGGDVLQLSVKTPWPPLFIAVALATLRHVRCPKPHVLARMLAALRRFAAQEGFKVAWRPFVATRTAVLAVGLLAVCTFGMPTEAKRQGLSDSVLVNLPLRFDAGWYLSVARSGYLWFPGDRERARQQNIVFFPALPMGMRVLGYLFGRSGIAFLYAGVLISHVAFLAALVLLFELARDDLGDDAAAGAAVMLLCTYPFSLFHGAVYTESLYLLGVVAAILACKRERWTQAMAWGVLVGLTRPNGFVLSATLGVLLFEAMLRRRSAIGRLSVPSLSAALAIAAPIGGAAIYWLFLWHLTGHPFQWSEQQVAWGRTFSGFSPLRGAAEFAMENGLESYVEGLPYDFINAVPAIAALALAIPIGRRLSWAYTVFIVTNLVPPLLLGGLQSTGRFTATLFPIFIWLGLKTRSATPSVALWFAMLQSLVAALFYTWHPLF
jgi:Mannosyltransferase (PIG-V)